MNELKSLSPAVLARLIKAVLADSTALNDEEYVLLFNALVEANEPYQGYYEHCIRNVENELDDEVETMHYRATELLDMCAHQNQYSSSITLCTWYANAPQLGGYDWADDPRDLKIVRSYDFDYMLDHMDHVIRDHLFREFEHAGCSLTDPLLDYLRNHPELAD